MLHFLLQLTHMTRLRCKVQVPCSQLAIDLMGLDEVADLLHRLQTQLPEPFGGFITDPFFDTGLICPLPRADMPAIAPRGTPTDPLRFE